MRAGNISLDPVNTNDSVMHAFNTMYVLGSMPQDSLNVTAPTSFEVAPSQQGSPRTSVGVYTGYFGAYNVVNQPADFYTVLSWPFQASVITDSSDPAVLVGNPPPSGVNYFDTTLLYRYDGPDPRGFPDVLVPVRMYPLTSAPTTIDNTANFDASQLRGAFNFQVAQPDYSAAETLATGFGYRFALPAEAFGQTTVVLSKVNPQLSVSITGTPPVASADFNNLNSFDALGVVHYPGAQVTVGTGTLADVQGDVAVHNVWMKEVNDRLGISANVLTMTGSALTGWVTTAGTTHPSLTFDTLLGDLAVSGSPVDRFDIEGTPDTAPRVTLQNFATSGPAAGVYLMGKSVMPLFVTGNFTLNVGRRLTADGTVANVGQVDAVYDYHNRFNPDGAGLFDSFTQQHLFENLQVFNPNGAVLVPGVTYDTYVADYIFSGQQPLPVFFNYTGSGQSTFVFDTSGDVLNHGHWGNISFAPSTNYIGIAANANYPGQADLRFFQGDVLYGSNIETFFYGPQLIGAQTSQNKAGPSVLIDNPSTSPVHYIGGAHSANDSEEILVGAARGPVTVAGAGLGTLVELNPLFSLPLANPTLVGTAEQIFSLHGIPGWTSGNSAGFSLLDTILADVTVTGASLRVIGDIPLPAGMQPPLTLPDVRASGNQITGIAGATVHFSNLLDVTSTSTSAGWGGNLDMEIAELPGLSILLPGHAAAASFVDDTPAGITTAIGSVLSSSDATFTAGAMSVLKTTGPLLLGQLFANTNYPWPAALGQPIGSLSWADGLSIPSITIGNGGSVQNIHGPILLLGDPHSNSPLVTNIDGSSDPARSIVTFVAQSYLQAPDGIIASKVAAVSGFSFFEEVQGFAPATIYFGPYFNRVRNLNFYGSAGSSYNVAAAPPTMRLYAGANSSVVDSSGPISIFGATTVQLVLASYSDIPGYSGTPQVVVEQDPTHPQPIALRVDQMPFGVFPTTPAGTLHLDNVGGSLLALALNTGLAFGNPNYWSVLYDGSNTHLAVNYGPIVISDTGAAGTTISSGVQSIDVYGTTGPLTINPSGSAFSGGTVRLGQSGNMQAIHGDVTILSSAAPLPAVNLTLNNSADTTRRTIHLATDVDGNTLVTGMAPDLIKLIGPQFGPTLNGGVGGSTFDVETKTSPFTYILGGSTTDLLVGPDSSNVWQILNGNSIYLNSNLLVQNVPNVRGGTDTDTFNLSGQLPGDLDGGAGINTLSYPNYAAWHGVPFDLVHGIAPLVGGLASHLQIVPIEMTGVSNQQRQAGVPIAPIQFPILGGLGSFVYSATGLPAGLAIAPNTGLIIGTLLESAASATPYAIHVSANDGFNTATADFQLTVLPGVAVANPGTQSQSPGTPINLAIQATSVYGQPLTYSATGLPAGLSIAPSTGVVSGAISDSAESGSPYLVNVTATDGTHTGGTTFQWIVLPSFSLVNPGTPLAPEGVPVNLLIHANNPANRSLTFYYSASFGVPSYLYFTSLDNSTAAFQGTVYAYGGTYFWPVTVYATDGTSTVSTSFNIETVPGFGVYPAYDQTNRAGDTVYVYAGVYSNAHGHDLTYEVSGMPPGLAFDAAAANITGTIDVNANTSVPYHTLITVTDHTLNYVYPISFQWTVTPLIILGQLSDQSSTVGTAVDLPVSLIRDFGRPVTFSADNLPLGVSIDPTTGRIHGTIGPQTASPADLSVVVHADDGQATGDISFTWHVASAVSNVVQLADTIHGGVVTLTSPIGTSLSATFSDLYYPNAIETPLGFLTLSVAGLAPGAAANVVITPPVGHNWTDYYVYGPTPDGAYGWYDFLYQHQTDANDASVTGAEFLPNGQIVLHLLDGGRGDSDLSPDGVISMAAGGGPAFTQLQAHISAAPQSWPLGVPLTLNSEVNGTAAAGATFDWQVWVYTNDFQYLQVAEVNTSSITFSPQVAGTYYVTLAVTSQSEQFTANDYLNFPVAAPTGSAPLSEFGTAGLAGSVISGQTFGGQVLALDAEGNFIANYTATVSAVIADEHGHSVANLSGNFSGGVFTFSAQSIATLSRIPVTYTLSLTSGSVSAQLPLIIHPISHIGAVDDTPITAIAGQSFSFAV
ncbi:MAG TPA: putative Ig domain-containing protein, partial [Lacipirellulaceae bacterium]|nr:putative Ig domain-containing protein [Lacipirellulaceae bacterium]